MFIKLCTQPDIPKPTTELASFQDRRGLPKRRLGFEPQQNCRSHYAAIICCREMTLTELSALHTKKTTTNKHRQAALIIFWISRESGQRNSFELDVRNKYILNSQNKNDRLLTLRQCCVRSSRTGTKARFSSFPFVERVPGTRSSGLRGTRSRYFSKIRICCCYLNFTLLTLIKYCARYMRR